MLFCCFSMIDWVYLSLTYLTRPNFNILSLVSLGECAYYDADTLVILGPNSAEETTFLVVDRWGLSDVQWVLMVLVIDHHSRWTQTWGFYIRFYATINSSTEMYCFDGSMIGCAHCNWEMWRLKLIGIAANDESLTMFHRLTCFQQPIAKCWKVSATLTWLNNQSVSRKLGYFWSRCSLKLMHTSWSGGVPGTSVIQ